MGAARRRRTVAAVVVSVVASLLVIVGPLGTTPAQALDAGWTVDVVTDAGPDMHANVLNDATTGPAIVAWDNFASDVTATGADATLTFSTIATTTGQVDIDLSFEGWQGFAGAEVEITTFVFDGVYYTYPTVVTDLGPSNCCDDPSPQYSTIGSLPFTVNAGDQYGFIIRVATLDEVPSLYGRFLVGDLGTLRRDMAVVGGFSAARTNGDTGFVEAGFDSSRGILTDPARFGLGAPVTTPITFAAPLDTITSDSLIGVDLFVVGSVPTSSYSPAEQAALLDYVDRGGKVLATSDGPANSVAPFFGLTEASGTAGPQRFLRDAHPIADGPFGVVDSIADGGSSYFTDLGGVALEVARDTQARTTIAEILPYGFGFGPGRVVFLDASIVFGAGGVPVPDQVLAANVFARALDPDQEFTWDLGTQGLVSLFGISYDFDTQASTVDVAAWATGIPGGDEILVIETSDTCVDGALVAPQVAGEMRVPIDGTGTGYVSGQVDLDFAESPVLRYASAYLTNGETWNESSPCIVTGVDNDTWTRAQEIVLTGDGAVRTGSANGAIDAPGRSRWYRFAVQPGAEATISLTGLSENYDLAVYTDITQSFEDLTGDDDEDGLNELSAEYAPAVFSPAVFSPAVFSPAVFSPDAYSPAVFSPAVFSPAVFSPAVFSPAVFSPAVFSPAVFSPAVFSPAVFSPAVFSPAVFSPAVFSPAVFSAENYASAQVRSLNAVSASDGTADETVVTNTWNNTGYFYVRVTGRNGAYDAGTPFTVSVSVDGAQCAGVAPLEAGPGPQATPGSLDTLVLWDPARMPSDVTGNDAAAMAELEADLEALVARPEVDGTIVDLGAYPTVVARHAQADEADACPYAENLVAEAVKDVVDQYRAANPDLRYIVLVGGDAQIPFFRYPDQALIGPEQNYEPPMADGTQSQASLRLNYILGQDEYGASRVLSLRDGPLPLPELAVGRLVESAADIDVVLDAYLSTPDGVVTPTSSLVTGYDFLTDSAEAVDAELVAGMNRTPGVRNDTLITAADISPRDPRSWTADDLRRELLDEGEDVVFLAGHFSANSALAADYQTSVLATELEASDVDLTNSLVFSGGCHSGYNIVDSELVPGVTEPLDWSQVLARKGATLVAGTGYQYGDTDFLEYSERLYATFAQELRRGEGPVPIGEAFVRAKQAYLSWTPELRPLHYKSLLISTVFGLPMLRVDMQGERLPADTGESGITPTAAAAGTPGAILGLQSADIDIDDIESTLSERTVELTNLDGGTLAASYYEGPDGVMTNPAEPAVPLVVRQLGVPDTSVRGVGLRTGRWREERVVPLTGAPTTELRGVHTPFVSTVNFPMRLSRTNYFGALTGTGGTTLQVTPVQHRVDAVGDVQATRRVFDQLGFRAYYSSDTRTYGTNTPALSAAPSITNVRAVIVGNDVQFVARVSGDPAAGIQGVWVTYTDGSGTSGTWQSLDLVQDPTDSTTWSATLPGAAAPGAFGRLDYLIQAVSGTGLVTMDDNLGAYYRIAGTAAQVDPDGTPAVTTAPTALTVSAPTSATYGTTVTVSATLTSEGSPLAGQRVLLDVGGTTRSATTDSSGTASAQLPIAATPGPYTAKATFAGSTTLSPSSSSQSITVTKATTSLTAASTGATAVAGGVDTGVTATLVDQTGVPLLQRTVYFTIEGTGVNRTVARTTDPFGTARLGIVDLDPGSYVVTARFLGTVPTQSGSLELSDPVYLPSSDDTDFTATPANRAPVIDDTPASVLVAEGSSVALSATVTDPDGDDVTTAWSSSDTAVVTVSDPADVTTEAVGVDEGSASLTLAASDGVLDADPAVVPVTVTNAPPVVTSFRTPRLPVPVTNLVTVQLGAADPGVDDRLLAVVHWGDETGFGGRFLTSATTSLRHRYSRPGVYEVAVAVCDDATPAACTTTSRGTVVVYDPAAGYVTGSGQLQIGPGASTSAPSAEGRVKFTVDARYLPGQRYPTGSVDVAMFAASFQFRSTSLSWLFTDGATSRIGGRGRIGNAGDYDFVLTTVDGAPDRLRLQVWTRVPGGAFGSGALVFDTQRGDPTPGATTTPLSKGSIQLLPS